MSEKQDRAEFDNSSKLCRYLGPQCRTQTYFHTVELAWAPKKWARIFTNFTNFFLTLISVINAHSTYLIILYLCLVVWHQKAAKQSHNLCRSVFLMVRSPILLLKCQSHYMYRYAQKNSGYGTGSVYFFHTISFAPAVPQRRFPCVH